MSDDKKEKLYPVGKKQLTLHVLGRRIEKAED